MWPSSPSAQVTAEDDIVSIAPSSSLPGVVSARPDGSIKLRSRFPNPRLFSRDPPMQMFTFSMVTAQYAGIEMVEQYKYSNKKGVSIQLATDWSDGLQNSKASKNTDWYSTGYLGSGQSKTSIYVSFAFGLRSLLLSLTHICTTRRTTKGQSTLFRLSLTRTIVPVNTNIWPKNMSFCCFARMCALISN